VIVRTGSGDVRGAEKRGVAVWRGIPYASAPRFRAPGPAPSWTGVRDATRFGAVAMQSTDPRMLAMSGVSEKLAISEDCLFLNVTAPADYAVGAKRPVLVWIHGGAFVFGAGSTPLYDATSFAAAHGLVVVTINYRLGAFGFAPLAGDANVGLYDQIAALRWIADNIAGFGGDPARVTAMGESAGAVSIAMLLGMPAARGLFARAILESGAVGLSPPTADDAALIARAIAEECGDPMTAPAETILAVQDRIVRERGLGAFFPHTTGASPLDVVREGGAAGVPLLLGSNRDEWNLFALFLGDASVAPVAAALRARLGDAAIEAMLAAYARHARTTEQAWIDLIGDAAFRIPAIRLAEAQVAHAPVWMYRFDFESTSFGGKLGAAHALELPFVWSVLDSPAGAILLGPESVAPARTLGAAMHDAWAAFVRGGSPESAGLPPWPRYQLPRRQTMLLDRACAVADDPGGDTRIIWP
jgi:para-nitrobenzyl esterase